MLDVAGALQTRTLAWVTISVPERNGAQNLCGRSEALARLRVLHAHVAAPELRDVVVVAPEPCCIPIASFTLRFALMLRERAVWGVVKSTRNPGVSSRGRSGALHNHGYETQKVSTHE